MYGEVRTVDFHGHPVSDQVLNGTSVVSTTSYGEDGLDRTTQVSNPTAPGATALYTTYAYDGLGRVISTTPPEATTGAGQNAYAVSYSEPASLSTDPASQQRKQYVNGLGQVVRVDLPGPTGGASGSGSATISGTEQSVSVSSGGGATPGTGSVSIGGSENSTQVLTHAATAATGFVTFNGSEQSKYIQGDSVSQAPFLDFARPNIGVESFESSLLKLNKSLSLQFLRRIMPPILCIIDRLELSLAC